MKFMIPSRKRQQNVFLVENGLDITMNHQSTNIYVAKLLVLARRVYSRDQIGVGRRGHPFLMEKSSKRRRKEFWDYQLNEMVPSYDDMRAESKKIY